MGSFDLEIAKNPFQHRYAFQGRVFLPLAIFILLACAFLFRQPTRSETSDSLLLDETPQSVEPERSASPKWEPPLEWDPVNSIYGSFEE